MLLHVFLHASSSFINIPFFCSHFEGIFQLGPNCHTFPVQQHTGTTLSISSSWLREHFPATETEAFWSKTSQLFIKLPAASDRISTRRTKGLILINDRAVNFWTKSIKRRDLDWPPARPEHQGLIRLTFDLLDPCNCAALKGAPLKPPPQLAAELTANNFHGKLPGESTDSSLRKHEQNWKGCAKRLHAQVSKTRARDDRLQQLQTHFRRSQVWWRQQQQQQPVDGREKWIFLLFEFSFASAQVCWLHSSLVGWYELPFNPF